MSIDPKTIDAVRQEAQRVLARCDTAEAAFEWRAYGNEGRGYWSNNDTKATGALRRASMDLTRALADLRRAS